MIHLQKSEFGDTTGKLIKTKRDFQRQQEKGNSFYIWGFH